MQLSGKVTQILMAVIASILVVAALKATRPISMPLAFAFFITILVHPLQSRLERRLPRWLSLILVLLLLCAIAGIAVGEFEITKGVAIVLGELKQ